MSNLAYYEFEGPNGYIDDMVKVSKKFDLTENVKLHDFLEEFANGLVTRETWVLISSKISSKNMASNY